MRGKGGATLGEVMGNGPSAKHGGIDLHNLHELLGEDMPKLEFHALGRVRLIRALRNRFGAGYRSKPGISELLNKFDQEAHTELQHHLIKKRLGRK